MAAVESLSYLSYDFCTQLLICREQVPIKAVGSQSFVEVRLLGCLCDIFNTEHRCGVDLVFNHVYVIVMLATIVEISSHMFGSLVDT